MLVEIWDTIVNHATWTYKELTLQNDVWYKNYFVGLVLISLIAFLLEILFPWRKYQKVFRKDFWLDTVYMFLNFFVFNIALYGLYAIVNQLISYTGISISDLALVSADSLPLWVQLLIFFILSDFVQWITHIALHRVPLFWEFHKVHHSVKEMGFAAHLRYHWMENVLYRPLKYLVVVFFLGVEPTMAIFIHFITIAIGHLNHANVNLNYGPLKYVFNNPKMHIWHHSKELPKDRKYGMNYGISLSMWDYIFKTAYIPRDGKDIELGFHNDEKFPKTLGAQIIYPLGKEE